MNNISYVVVLAAILMASTLVFPAEGKKALILRIVNGILFGISCVLLCIAVAVKLPELGWGSFSMPLLSILAVACLAKMVITLGRALPDLKNNQIMEYYLTSWTLVRGSTLHTPTSVYYIKGCDQTGKKVRFYISKNTFLDLLDEPGRYHILVRVFERTKIVLSTAVIRRF